MVSKMSGLAQKRDRRAGRRSVGLARSTRRPVGHADGEGLASSRGHRVRTSTSSRAGERVDHRDADAVQAAGDLVAAAAELAAGVEHGQHDRHGGQLLARARRRRGCRGRCRRPGCRRRRRIVTSIRVAVAGQRLVDGVVDDLLDEVVQAALAGRADVHAGALADRLEPLEHLDRAGVVGAGLDAVAGDASPRMLARTTSGALGWSAGSLRRLVGVSSVVVSSGVSSISSATQASCSSRRESLDRAEGCSGQRNGRLAKVGDHVPVYPSQAHNHASASRECADPAPEIRLSEPQKRARSARFGGPAGSPYARGRPAACCAPESRRSAVGVARAAALDAQPPRGSTTARAGRPRR